MREVLDKETGFRLSYKLKRPVQNMLNIEKQKHWLWVLLRTVLIIGISYVILYPLLLKLSIGFKSKEDIFNPNIVWLPHHLTLSNLKYAYTMMNYPVTLMNTIFLSTSTMLLQTIASALAGYTFARLTFRGSGFLFILVILTILIPPQTLMVPLYLHFKNFDILGIYHLFTGKDGVNLINTYWPLLITSATANGLKSGLYIYIFRQFFKGMPKEIEEAAFIDGCGVFTTFFRVMLPNAIPSIVTVMLFAFVWQWNDSFMTATFMNQSHVMSMEITMLGFNANQVLVAALSGGDPNFRVDPYYISMIVDTGILLAIAPLIIMYLFVQRFFVESVERTGVVG
ncbi:carbohydrate ABC transporter permease [Paenibacillus solisilvae]|uniref:Carbohydrate ABC transporter permease n=1 Tax=Paenibacillus solisilvae TaxID=2486751 RepID=A0ABW0W190_9BACL